VTSSRAIAITSDMGMVRFGVVMAVLLGRRRPGLTQAEMIDATKRHLPEDLFPGGAKAGWWVECVQLDLEAEGLVERDRTAKPLRWRRGQRVRS
jgi:hypothetical protein